MVGLARTYVRRILCGDALKLLLELLIEAVKLAYPKGALLVLFVLSFGVCCRPMDSLCPSACAVCMSHRYCNHQMKMSPLCGLSLGHCKTYNAQQLL